MVDGRECNALVINAVYSEEAVALMLAGDETAQRFLFDDLCAEVRKRGEAGVLGPVSFLRDEPDWPIRVGALESFAGRVVPEDSE